uniref:DUF2461 domain-containing protein n=1 Tax=uncultured Dysgonomonas sp. TaxID=206096 RepID=UPI002617A7F2|nr:DUF2461 domain-containing protein [uncultured Dysgonomonas sp.]
MAFNGFTPATIQFFKDLQDNNYKEWFEEHRSVYDNELVKPFKELISTLTPTMYNIDSQFELRPHRVLSRIYRDVRFSKNKDPYKTCLWMSFQVPTPDWVNIPGFFMELNAETYFYGMGLFAPKKKTMDALRDSIAYDAKEFQAQTQKILDRGFVIYGDEYKRPIPNELSEYFQPWVQRKNLYVGKNIPINEDVFSPKFAEIIREDYESLVWLYDFLKDE